MGLVFETPKQHSFQPNMNNKPPMLFLLGEHSTETKHGLFDLDQEKLNIVEIPQHDAQLHYLSSGYGWLLLLSREEKSLFFFNPFTAQRNDLPYRSAVFSAATFSAAPTSHDCVLYAIERDCFNGNFHIDTLLVGQERVWTRYKYSVTRKQIGVVMKTLVSNGILYLVDSYGRVSSFVRGGGWTSLSHKDLKHVRFSHVLELEGVIYGVKSGNHQEIEKVYTLKLEDGKAMSWEEVEDLGDATMFLCPTNSFAVKGLGDELRKKVVVANENPESRCVIYNIGKDGCEMTKSFRINEFSWSYAPIWI